MSFFDKFKHEYYKGLCTICLKNMMCMVENEEDIMKKNVAKAILEQLREREYEYLTGVPCSYLNGLYKLLKNGQSFDYISAIREDLAIGIATGIQISGGKCAVLMQDSGMGYCLNVFTSLNLLYHIPILCIVSWRGHDPKDAIEHSIIGKTIHNIIEEIGMDKFVLDLEAPKKTISKAIDVMERTQKPVVVLVSQPI